MTLEEIKNYLRVDSEEDNTQILSLLEAASKYIKGKTGKTLVIIDAVNQTTGDIENDELYNLCLKLMIAHWYENRAVEVTGNLKPISHSVDAIISHITYSGDYL